MKHTRKRYQAGSLTIEKRKNGPDVWAYSWRESGPNNSRIQRKRIIGTKQEYPTKSSAQKAVEGMQLDINVETASSVPVTVSQVIAHYTEIELAETNGKTARTKAVYLHQLESVISPRWGSHRLSDVKPIAVEKWLNDMQVAPGTRYKTKGVLSVLFQHAMRYEWATTNPIRLVRQSAVPQQEEIVLTAVEVSSLLSELRDPFQTLILLASVTGLRRGELFGLKWEDVNFYEAEIHIVRSVVDQVEGPPKTLASRRPIPMSSELASALEKLENANQLLQTGRLDICQSASNREKTLLARCGTQAAYPAGSRAGWHHEADRLAQLPPYSGDSVAVLWRIGKDDAGTHAPRFTGDHDGSLCEGCHGRQTTGPRRHCSFVYGEHSSQRRGTNVV